MVAGWRRKEMGVENSPIKGGRRWYFINIVVLVRVLGRKQQKPTPVDLNIKWKKM